MDQSTLFFLGTGNIEYLFDPIDLFFALFKVELTDARTFWVMLGLTGFGVYRQFSIMKKKGVPLDMPIIGFESP